MESWQIVLSVSLIIPLVMVIAGICFRNGLPRKVNWWTGYRTSMACKNQDTWVFAHKYLAKLLIPLGLIFIFLVAIFALLAAFGIFTLELLLWLAGAQAIAFFLLSFIPTEMALRKEFDRNGKRRQ